MAVAIMFQTGSAALTSDKRVRQTFVIPTPHGVKLFTRTTDGAKGPKNAWAESAPQYDADETVSAPAVGVILAQNDYTDLERRGFAPVLAQKAGQALGKILGEEPPAISPADLLAEVADVVTSQDYRAATYVRDGRRKSPPVLTAVGPLGPVTPVTGTAAPVAPVVAATAPVAAPASQLATVPDKGLGKRYISRQVDGAADFAILDMARDCRFNVLIMGPTGSGKTTLPIAWSAATGRRCYSVSGNQSVEPSQLFGKYVPDGVGGFVWIDGPVTEIVRNGGTLILDEVNFISPKITTVLFSLLDARREITLLDHHGEVIRAHDDLVIVGTGNPGYIGTNRLNEAFHNRHAIHLEWDYDAAVERKLVRSKSLREMVSAIRAQAENAGIETPIGTNVMIEFEKIIGKVGWTFARGNFLRRFEAGEERQAVETIIDTYADNIIADLGIGTAPVTTEDDNAPEEDDEPAPWDA